jgi:hypothetical protein
MEYNSEMIWKIWKKDEWRKDLENTEENCEKI